MIFRARQFEFRFPRPALVMGIVNVTPDSFSDGGKFLDPDAAVAHALELVAQGAEILDIGGESTRPGAAPVGEAEELRRVIPVIEKLAARKPRSPLSIDTMKPAVARAALAAGASIVNDVGASRAGRRDVENRRRISGRLHLHARARLAADDAAESGLRGCRPRSRRFFFGAAGDAAERGRHGGGTGGAGPGHRLWQDAGAQFAVARRPAKFYKMAAAAAARRLAEIVHRKIDRRKIE